MAEDDATSECFVVSPIGPADSLTRKRSDSVLDQIVRPAAEAHGMTAVRADQIDDPGQITTQIIRHIMDATAVVADLTDLNPNVFYEVAIADAFRVPVVMIAEAGTQLPADVMGQRAHFFDSTDLNSGAAARSWVTEALGKALANGGTSSPVETAASRAALSAGDGEQQALASIADRLDSIEQVVRLRPVLRARPVEASDPPQWGNVVDRAYVFKRDDGKEVTVAESTMTDLSGVDTATLQRLAAGEAVAVPKTLSHLPPDVQRELARYQITGRSDQV